MVEGAFHASDEDGFDLDPYKTADEIQRCGAETLAWLEQVTADEGPLAVLPISTAVFEIHKRWFATTFPAQAGVQRFSTVVNRKGTAIGFDMIPDAVQAACGDWMWRRENRWPKDVAEQIEFIVAEANTLTVRIYDIHPFIDGNTRATWHLRNYLLMLDGLHPLTELTDFDAYKEAWWNATPHEHQQLDDIVLTELFLQDEQN